MTLMGTDLKQGKRLFLQSTIISVISDLYLWTEADPIRDEIISKFKELAEDNIRDLSDGSASWDDLWDEVSTLFSLDIPPHIKTAVSLTFKFE